MFLAHDRMELREQKVRHYCGAGKKPEPGILLLLAAVNLEWTVCRAVRHLYLSSPRAELSNSELQTRIKGCSGLKKYKKLWENEVMHVRECLQLDQIIPLWPEVREAFEARHALVHGRGRYYSEKAARPHIEVLLQAARSLDAFCEEMGFPLHRTIPKARRKQTHARVLRWARTEAATGPK